MCRTLICKLYDDVQMDTFLGIQKLNAVTIKIYNIITIITNCCKMVYSNKAVCGGKGVWYNQSLVHAHFFEALNNLFGV